MILFPPKLGVNGTILPFWSVFEARVGNEKDLGSGGEARCFTCFVLLDRGKGQNYS